MTPELLVLSRDAAERYQPDGAEICISIRDPSADPVRLSSSFRAVLELAFSDLLERGTEDDVLFSENHAARILEFLSQWPQMDRVVIHCNAGVSRSPGVALGLCDVHGWATEDLERNYPAWNRLVRQVIAAAWRVT